MPKRLREESMDSDSRSPETGNSTIEPFDEESHSSKYVQTSNEPAKRKTVMKCSLPPHAATLSFSTFEEFEVHYAKVHGNRCPECHKNFPSEHFLSLHIEENHDPLVDARKAKGEKTYRCFIEDCDKVCAEPHKRRMHLIDKHIFPKNYDFSIVNTGIDKKNSMLRSKHRKSATNTSRPKLHERDLDTPEAPLPAYDTDRGTRSPTTANAQSTEETSVPTKVDVTSEDNGLESLTSSMSALKFVPPSVRFGRGGKRGGFSRS